MRYGRVPRPGMPPVKPWTPPARRPRPRRPVKPVAGRAPARAAAPARRRPSPPGCARSPACPPKQKALSSLVGYRSAPVARSLVGLPAGPRRLERRRASCTSPGATPGEGTCPATGTPSWPGAGRSRSRTPAIGDLVVYGRPGGPAPGRLRRRRPHGRRLAQAGAGRPAPGLRRPHRPARPARARPSADPRRRGAGHVAGGWPSGRPCGTMVSCPARSRRGGHSTSTPGELVTRPGTEDRPLRVAIVGAGPAGIYAADVLMKSDTPVSIDLYERQPAPFGLIRYGVAPDHPRIKGIVKALHQVLSKPQIRLLGNVEYGVDVKLEDLRRYYDAVVFTTGAEKDRDLDIPGIDKAGSFGGADFVSWFDGHPDVPREWPLEAELDRRRRRRQRRPRRRPHAVQDRRRAAGHRDPGQRLPGPQGLAGRGGARLRPPRPGPGEVHPARAARARPLAQRRGPRQPRGHRVRRRLGRRHQQRQPDQARRARAREVRDAHRRPPGQGQPADRPRKLWLHFFESPVEVLGDGSGRGLPHRAHRADRRRQRPRHGRVHTTGRSRRSTAASATAPPSCRACRGTAATTSCRTPPGGCSASTARRCRASTSTAGSSAARSA